MSAPRWREPIHLVVDEDTGVPQTAAGWRWLASGRAVTLTDPALVVLADVVATLAEGEPADAHDAARLVIGRLMLLYGLRVPEHHDTEEAA